MMKPKVRIARRLETNGLPVLNVSHPFAFHGFYGSNNESGMPSSLVETVNFDLKLIVKLLLFLILLPYFHRCGCSSSPP